MRRVTSLALLVALSPGAALPQAPADAVPAASLDALRACMRRNTPPRTSLQTLEVRARDRIGSERTLRAKVYWKRDEAGLSRLRADFYEPQEIDGAGFLMIEEPEGPQLWLFLPELRKTRRVSSQMLAGKVFGTDFSYEDFARMYRFGREEDWGRLPDRELDGATVQVLEGRIAPETGSAYERALAFVDPGTCVAVRTELYERGGELRKLLTAARDQIVREAELWIPRVLLMRDLREQTETRLVVQAIEIGAPIRDRVFSLGELGRQR